MVRRGQLAYGCIFAKLDDHHRHACGCHYIAHSLAHGSVQKGDTDEAAHVSARGTEWEWKDGLYDAGKSRVIYMSFKKTAPYRGLARAWEEGRACNISADVHSDGAQCCHPNAHLNCAPHRRSPPPQPSCSLIVALPLSWRPSL